MPTVFSKVFADTCSITAEVTSQGTTGEMLTTSTSTVYSDVPCNVQPNKGKSGRKLAGGGTVSVSDHIITLPVYLGGERMSLQATYKIVTDERGDEPSETYTIDYIVPDHGIRYLAYATKEG